MREECGCAVFRGEVEVDGSHDGWWLSLTLTSAPHHGNQPVTSKLLKDAQNLQFGPSRDVLFVPNLVEPIEDLHARILQTP